jgi:arylsulfatase A-like enzyme
MDVHDFREIGTSYDAAVEAVDGAIGSLLERLRAAGLLEGTTLVVTSDHGERLGETHALEGRPSHFGNPSFETLLRVPLIVWPRGGRPAPAVARGQDTRRLIEALAGIDTPVAAELREDEVLLTERWFLSYRRFPWKSFWNRRDDRLHLFNLEDDPGEQHDVAPEQEARSREQRERMAHLAAALSVRERAESGLSESDRQRLRALGYLD